MQLKSEKLKKLEAELSDLERWMELGLVPKKDLPKHEEEIAAIRTKINDEVERLKFLKEHGDLEEYVAPKRQAGKTVYQAEMPTIPDVEFGENQATEGFENTETEAPASASDTTLSDDTETAEDTISDEDEESYFSERARWRRGGRGGIIDPEADDW